MLQTISAGDLNFSPKIGQTEAVLWPAANFVVGRLSSHSGGLELHGTEVAEFRMPSARVVEALNAVEHVGTRFVAGAVDFAGCALGLQRGKETLHRGVTPDIARAVHRAGDAVVCQKPLKLLACVFRPLV